MPSLIPSLNSCIARMTSGEKRFAVRLEQKLDDDYLIWYDVPIGKKQLHPDFIVLHPLRGLLVLEVKDWKIDTIVNVTRANWTIADRNTNEPKQVKNPLEQARNYVLHAVKLLERDADLVHAIAAPHAGKCIVPYGYGVVLTNITRAVFDKQGLGDAIESNLVICQDEMYDSVDDGDFQQRLWDMFPYHFDRTLSPHQVNRIRWHIFPDIAIQPSLLPEPEEDESASTSSLEQPVDDAAKAGQAASKRIVWVKEGDLLKAIDIQIGDSDYQFTQVVSGDLKAGDELVVGLEKAK